MLTFHGTENRSHVDLRVTTPTCEFDSELGIGFYINVKTLPTSEAYILYYNADAADEPGQISSLQISITTGGQIKFLIFGLNTGSTASMYIKLERYS